jgi:mannose/fructose/N-acetylgalactosamine-specific phosphotransferase system component IIB
MDSKLTIDKEEYSCKSNNKTMICIKKDFLNEALQKATLKQVLLYLASIIFDSTNKDFYKKQRILALINLVKSVRENIENKNDIYSLNLIIRNLEAYKKNQKLGENYILNEDMDIVITTLITLAFSNGFNKILKSLYIK